MVVVWLAQKLFHCPDTYENTHATLQLDSVFIVWLVHPEILHTYLNICAGFISIT